MDSIHSPANEDFPNSCDSKKSVSTEITGGPNGIRRLPRRIATASPSFTSHYDDHSLIILPFFSNDEKTKSIQFRVISARLCSTASEIEQPDMSPKLFFENKDKKQTHTFLTIPCMCTFHLEIAPLGDSTFCRRTASGDIREILSFSLSFREFGLKFLLNFRWPPLCQTSFNPPQKCSNLEISSKISPY